MRISIVSAAGMICAAAILAQSSVEKPPDLPRYSSKLNSSLPGPSSPDADSVAHWTQLAGHYRSLILHPTNPDIRFAIGQDEVIYRSTTAGATWAPVSAPFSGRITRLAAAAQGGDVLYALGEGLAFARSEDQGDTWVQTGREIASEGVTGQLLPDPDQPDHIFVAGDSIWESRDGGRHFLFIHGQHGQGAYTALALDRGDLLAASAGGAVLRISHGSLLNVSRPRSGEISALVPDAATPGVMYVTYSTPRRQADEAQVYRSFDGGYQWAPLDGQEPGRLPATGVRSLAVDPGDSNRLYLATDAGVLISLTGGAMWLREESGMQDAAELVVQSVDTGLEVTAVRATGSGFSTMAASSCTFSLSANSASLPADGGTGTVSVKASASTCSWRVAEAYSWITIVGGTSKKGNATITYRVAENGTTASRRTSSMTIAGQRFTVEQSGKFACSYTLNPAKATHPSTGGPGSFGIEAPAGCGWKLSAGGTAKVTSATSGSGSATVQYTVGGNSLGTERYYTIEVQTASKALATTFAVTVQAKSGSDAGGTSPGGGKSAATILTVPAVSAQVGQTVTLPWSLRETVSGRSASGSAAVQVNGVAVCTTTSSQCNYTVKAGAMLPGTYQIRVVFAGNTNYLASSGTGVLTVRRADTSLDLNVCPQIPSSGSVIVGPCPASTSSTFTAKLRRPVDSAALSGKVVRFLVNGAQVGSASSNGVGAAVMSIKLPFDPRVKLTRITAVFDGDQFHSNTSREVSTGYDSR